MSKTWFINNDEKLAGWFFIDRCFESYVRHFCLCFFSVFLMSCTKDVPVTLPPFESKIVVESYIVQGDSAIVVRLDQTIDPTIKNYWSAIDTSFASAQVLIAFDNKTSTLRRIQYEEQSRYFDNPITHGRIFALDGTVEGMKSFRLIVDYQLRHVEAACSMPPSLHVTNASLTGTLNNADMYTSFKLIVAAEFPVGLTYYMIRIRSKSFEGFTRKDSIWREFGRGYFVVTDAADHKEFNIDNIPYPSKRTGGYYEILIAQIEKAYYEFALTSSAQYGELDSVIPTETTEVPSNIRGGYGIFTAMSYDTLMVTIP